MKFIGIFLLLSLGRFSAASLADELKTPAPLQVGIQGFQSNASDLSVLVEAVERRLPLIGIGPEVSNAKNAAAGVGGQGDTFEAVVQAANQNKASLRQAFGLSLRQSREKLNLPAAAVAAEVVAPAAAPVKVEPLTLENWEKFCRCAEPALLALKTSYRLRAAGVDFARYELDALLDPDRGDGKFVAGNGMACGKHLGEHGVGGALNSLDDQIEVLAVLYGAGKSDLPELFHLYQLYAAMLRGEPLEAPLFWHYVWKKTAFRKLITPKLPRRSYEKWIDAFIATSASEITRDKISVVTSIPPAELKRAALADWEKDLGETEVPPCTR